jgi:hypothetical protein
MHLPRDLIAEIEHELRTSARELAADTLRTRILIELDHEARTAAACLGRPLGILIYLDSARTPAERARRAAQLRQLRAPLIRHETSGSA